MLSPLSQINIGIFLMYVTMLFLPASFVAVCRFSVFHLYLSSDEDSYLRVFLG